jgi:hypothetical protein
VGRAVRRLVAEGRPPDALDPELVSVGAEEVLGRPVEIAADTLRAALDPDACVASRRQVGSCAPDRLAEMLAECRGLVDGARRWEAEHARRAADAERALLDSAARLAAHRS